MKKFTKAVLLLLILSLSLISCGKDNKESVENKVENKNEVEEVNNNSQDNEENLSITELTELQTKNLEKLCKIWGYTKYTHSVFLLGEKDWDVELLNLIPKVYNSETEEETNDILLNWYTQLGEIDYKTTNQIPMWREAKEKDKVTQANTKWLSDKNYLGQELSNALKEFDIIPMVYNNKSPVIFNESGTPSFENEKAYEKMKFDNSSYRLLALFRFWNAMEYYYPYLDIIDEDWGEILIEYIPKMVEGNDKYSYNQTLASLSTKLKDGHTFYINTVSEERINEFLDEEFGKYTVPVGLTMAEDKIIIEEIEESYLDDSTLKKGDIPIEIDGIKIEDKINHCKKYLSYSEEDKIIRNFSNYILSSHNEKIKIKVLRDDIEKIFEIKGEAAFTFENMEDIDSYKIVDKNIGFINPKLVSFDKVDEVMKEFKNTDGLIVDLREYPNISSELEKYLFDKPTIYMKISEPSKAVPGTFLMKDKEPTKWSTELFYKKPVVVLIDEKTLSRGETLTMALRKASNVTVMGQKSSGTNGDVSKIILPGGYMISFSSLGIYTEEGEQTQRIGLSPDIYIEKTIKAISEGRDEYIEEAIKYILEK